MLGIMNCGDPEQVERRLAIYKGYGFEPLTSNPLRLFLLMATVKTLLDAETEAAGLPAPIGVTLERPTSLK